MRPEQSQASGPEPANWYRSPIWARANAIAPCTAELFGAGGAGFGGLGVVGLGGFGVGVLGVGVLGVDGAGAGGCSGRCRR